MKYERPMIVRRERIAGLLRPAPKSDGDTGISDIARKEHIVAVSWGEEESRSLVAYATPSIARRERIEGLMSTAPSSDQDFTKGGSDIASKEHIVAVTWDEPRERTRYAAPSIVHREQIQGLLDTTPRSDTDN